MNYLHIPNFSYILYSITKILGFPCFHCLQNDDVIKFDRFDSLFEFQYHKRNEHHKLSLHIRNFRFILNFVTKILVMS